MSEVLKGNAVVGQSGGPTAVINQSLVGVIEALAGHDAIGRLLGARHGVRGIVSEQFIDLKSLAPDLLERIAVTPCAALGSTRDKPDEAYCHKIFESFRKNDVRYFFYIGGNDSADTARIVSEKAAGENYDLHVFHIPKTIDNDLRVTDHCPGYGSAAKFVACGIMGDDRDNASLPGVKIDVIMGRHAGWLTAASVLGRRDEKDGPHLVYVPESPLTEEKFVDDVAEVYGRLGRCLVAVSEGIELPSGMSWGEHLAIKQDQDGISNGVERDSHGNVQLSGTGALGDALMQIVKEQVAAKLGGKKLRVRADTFGYLQRSFAGFHSAVDAREARTVGRKAVQYALAGRASGSVAMKRKEGPDYGVSYFRAELKDVARETKPLPKELISPTGRGVEEKAFRAYALPLVGELPEPGKLF